MPIIQYITKSFRKDSLDIIEKANAICAEYEAKGFDLTLRQLYYQFVARGLLGNTDKNYKRLGGIVNDARLAGLMDWRHINDRTRYVRENSHWSDPEAIIRSARYSFAYDKWADQPNHVEVWIEKDALVGVIAGVCGRLDVPYFSCRGYVSQSEMWSAGQRHRNTGKPVTVLHLGDHDPSGIDMTRDIQDRLSLFRARTKVKRIALTMDQVEEYEPPPNPAKLTDSRVEGYLAEYGDESWELDALNPEVLEELVEEHVVALRDDDVWNQSVQEERDARRTLEWIEDNYDDLAAQCAAELDDEEED